MKKEEQTGGIQNVLLNLGGNLQYIGTVKIRFVPRAINTVLIFSIAHRHYRKTQISVFINEN